TRSLIAAQLPQVLVMYDASDGSQVGSCCRKPSRGNQYLSWGKDAHHASDSHGEPAAITAACRVRCAVPGAGR
ncbi:MAG TPA: hypothetical protein VJ347_04100, partial [Streptosporangiaceae bacterium]|nr:hypothetical protein [Streptosporangiaceae bacterium]